MAETSLNVSLIAHTQLSKSFVDALPAYMSDNIYLHDMATDGQAVALTAIRTCYSPNKPTEIVAKEGSKYFGNKASDGEGGTDADRLFRHIVRSGHSSTLEHISFTFAIEGISRALMAQLTRHRAGFSFSVQSQRYVKLGSDDRSGGFDYIVPGNLESKKVPKDKMSVSKEWEGQDYFVLIMEELQRAYDNLRKAGVPAEDARSVLPNAAATNLVMTANLTALLSFYSKRRKGRGAQSEIASLADALRNEVVNVEPWTDRFFEEA